MLWDQRGIGVGSITPCHSPGRGDSPRQVAGTEGDGMWFGVRVEVGLGFLAFGECVSSPREGMRA